MAATAGPAPDFRGAAQETAASQNQMINAANLANRATSASPFASESWTRGADGSWQRSLGLAGGLGTGAANLGNEFGAATAQPLDPGLFGGVANGQQARDQAIDAEFNQAMSRLNPQLDRADAAARTRMANMGLDPRGQAARTMEGDLSRGRNDAITSTLNRAIASGREAGESVFNQNVQANQLAIANALRRRSAPLELAGQLQGFLNQPGYNQAQTGMGTDYYRALSDKGAWDQHNAEMVNQFWGDLAGGLMGAAGSAASFGLSRMK